MDPWSVGAMCCLSFVGGFLACLLLAWYLGAGDNASARETRPMTHAQGKSMTWSELARAQSSVPSEVTGVRIGPNVNQTLTWRNGPPEIIVDPSLAPGTIELKYGDDVVGRIVNAGLDE